MIETNYVLLVTYGLSINERGLALPKQYSLFIDRFWSVVSSKSPKTYDNVIDHATWTQLWG